MFGRREFLGGSAAGLAGLFLPGCRLFDPRRPAFGPEVRAEALRQLADGLFCGAAAGCVDCAERVYVGRQGLTDESAPVDELTRFDLASLTKLVTASVCATLVTEGRLDPDAPFTRYFPEHVLGEACPITVRDLATHASGFGNFSGARYSENPAVHGGVAALEDELRSKKPAKPRGTYCYSCYNYVLLGTIAERVGGKPLDRLAAERVFGPLGMTRARWCPVPDDGHVVSTPIPMHDGRLCPPGVVHDEIARHIGRPVGNAGVFATLPDLLRLADDLLNRRAFPKEHYDLLFTGTFAREDVCRSFGFDLSDDGRPAGFSPRSIRHTGFTGQIFLVDPDLAFAGIVLTTRRPDAKNTLAARHRLLVAMNGRETS